MHQTVTRRKKFTSSQYIPRTEVLVDLSGGIWILVLLAFWLTYRRW
jgi:hypothetical protein